jgi:HPt (histidine-containing phosphotransfer) domain-containing protein
LKRISAIMQPQDEGQVVRSRANTKVNGSILPALDHDILKRHTMQDAMLQKEVVHLFSVQLATIRARIAQGPIPASEAKVIAHTLLGAASAVGASKIAAIASKWHHAPLSSPQLRLELGRAMQEFLLAAQTIL